VVSAGARTLVDTTNILCNPLVEQVI
jgi:hypothetical protein